MNVPFSSSFPFLLCKEAHSEEVKASELCLQEESLSQMIRHLWLHVQVISLSVVKIAGYYHPTLLACGVEHRGLPRDG